jgi:hypothetical protein
MTFAEYSFQYVIMISFLISLIKQK